MKLIVLRVLFLTLSLVALFYPFIRDQHIPQVIVDKPKDTNLIETISIVKPKLAPWIESYRSAPNFSEFNDVFEKKIQFFSYFYPLIEAHNNWIIQARQFVQAYQKHYSADAIYDTETQAYFDFLLSRYKVVGSNGTKKISLLLKRLDIIPAELVLIQAANESGWGTSRFAIEGNNFFGQWCYQAGCGLVPSSREDGLNHEVASYEHAYQALQSYFINVNTNSAYRILRDMRANYRKMGQPLLAEVLATGLMNYSERGADYVQDIISMLRTNQSALSAAKKLISERVDSEVSDKKSNEISNEADLRDDNSDSKEHVGDTIKINQEQDTMSTQKEPSNDALLQVE